MKFRFFTILSLTALSIIIFSSCLASSNNLRCVSFDSGGRGKIDPIATGKTSKCAYQGYLLPSGKRVIFNTGGFDPSRIFVFDQSNQSLYDVSPYPLEIENFGDPETSKPFYDMNIDPSGRFVTFKVDLRPGTYPTSSLDYLLFDLALLENEIEKLDLSTLISTNIEEEYRSNPWPFLSFYKIDNFIISSESRKSILEELKKRDEKINLVYDFRWQKNIYSLKASDNADIYFQNLNNSPKLIPQSIWQGNPITGEIVLSQYDPSSPWPDVPADDPDYALLLKWRNDGVIPMQGNGALALDKAMTRKETVEFNYPVPLPPIPSDEDWPCEDMDRGDPLAPNFLKAFSQGLLPVDGNGGKGLCAPDSPVTRLEVIAMIFLGYKYRLEYADCKDRWPDYQNPLAPNAPWAAMAKNNGLLGEGANKLEPDKPVTKREAIRLEDLVNQKTIPDAISPGTIPCDIDKYAKVYTWDKDSAVSKLLRKREMTRKAMIWGGSSLFTLLALGGGVWMWRRKGK